MAGEVNEAGLSLKRTIMVIVIGPKIPIVWSHGSGGDTKPRLAELAKGEDVTH